MKFSYAKPYAFFIPSDMRIDSTFKNTGIFEKFTNQKSPKNEESLWKILLRETLRIFHSLRYANQWIRRLKTREYLKNLPITKNLQKSRKSFIRFSKSYFSDCSISSGKLVFSEAESVVWSSSIRIFLPPPINLISFLGSLAYRIYFSVHCMRTQGCTHRIRVTGLYVETFHPEKLEEEEEGKSIFLLSEATLVTLLEQETRVYDYLKGNRYLLRHEPKVQGLMILVAQPLCPPSQMFHVEHFDREEFSFFSENVP